MTKNDILDILIDLTNKNHIDWKLGFRPFEFQVSNNNSSVSVMKSLHLDSGTWQYLIFFYDTNGNETEKYVYNPFDKNVTDAKSLFQKAQKLYDLIDAYTQLKPDNSKSGILTFLENLKNNP